MQKQSLGTNQGPVVVSFYYGDDYYQKAAKTLIEDCKKLGLEYDIVEADLPKGTNWIAACRYKIQFIQRSLRKHKKPILWVDGDSRIISYPNILDGCKADIAFFLLGFRELKDFDPVALPRIAHPAYQYYSNSKRSYEFVDFMAKIEADYKGEPATDAYFLQEALKNFKKPSSILVFSPSLVTFDMTEKGEACFYMGVSGNTAKHKDDAKQHVSDLMSSDRIKQVLLNEVRLLVNERDLKGALVLLKRAYEHDKSDEKVAYRVARLMKRLGRLDDAEKFLKTFQTHNSLDIDHASRFKVDHYIEQDNMGIARKILERLVINAGPDRDWANSRMLHVELGERAARLGVAREDRPKVWWMESPYPGNFGDILNPYIVEHLSGIPPIFSPEKKLLIIGSVIRLATDSTQVWGSGTPRMTDNLNAKAHYKAVRGPLTRKLVIQSGGKCDEVYGDPAWFLPKIYTPKTMDKKYKLGVIKHHAHENDLVAGNGVRDISVIRAGYKGIEDFIDEINECEAILTTSLHGLIVSHAYGVPAIWCDVTGSDNSIPGDKTKYHDYLITVGLDVRDPIVFRKGTRITVKHTKLVDKNTSLPKKQINLNSLIETAPFKVRENWDKQIKLRVEPIPMMTRMNRGTLNRAIGKIKRVYRRGSGSS